MTDRAATVPIKMPRATINFEKSKRAIRQETCDDQSDEF